MSNIIPGLNATTLGTVSLRPLPDVEPFSIRSGYSFEGILSDIRTWLRDELVPYLEDNSAAAIFQENVDTMIDTVNKALSDQSAIVTAALNAAVNEVITAQVPVVDPIVLGVLQAVASQTRAYLDAHYVVYVPAPTGGDDTAMVQAILNAAQNTRGSVQFGYGTYRMNVATAQMFVQPKITGRGKQYTKFQPYNKTKPALIMQGGSGGESGGYLSDIGFVAHPDGGGIGLALQDVCDVRWQRLAFNGLDEAIRFAVTQDAGFCEFNHGEATIQAGSGIALHYVTSKSGETSFHGSGLDGGIINYSGSYAVVIEPNCFPYNAPLSCTVFTHSANTQVVRNRNVNREVSFFGTLRIEHQSTGYVILGANGDGHQRVLYVGEISALNGPVYCGNLYLCEWVEYKGGNTFKRYKPWSTTVTLSNGTVPIPLQLAQGEHALIVVEIDAPGWASYHLLSAFQSPYDPSVKISQLAAEVYTRANGQNDPQFTGSNGALQILDVSFNSGYTARVTVNPMHNGYNSPLSQN